MRGAPLSSFPFISVVVRWRILLVFLAAVALALGLWLLWPARYPGPAEHVLAQDEPARTAALDQPAPDFTLTDLNDQPVSLSSFAGRPVIVYFWATWCHYCIPSMQELEALRLEHRESGLEVLAVNILEAKERVSAHVRRHNLSLPVLLDLSGSVTRLYAVRATPTYYLIDRDGTVRAVIVGAARPGVLHDRLQLLLSTSPEGSPRQETP